MFTTDGTNIEVPGQVKAADGLFDSAVTITGSALSFTGGGDVTFNTTGMTGVTLPESGTLVASGSHALFASVNQVAISGSVSAEMIFTNPTQITFPEDDFTMLTTGPTSVTFPTSGTLATVGGSLGNVTVSSINGLTVASGGLLDLQSQSFAVQDYDVTLIATAATSVTLPPSGTLAVVDGALGNATATSINDIGFSSSGGGQLTLDSELKLQSGHDVEIVTSGTTQVVFPTSGYLVNRTSAETLENKTIQYATITASDINDAAITASSFTGTVNGNWDDAPRTATATGSGTGTITSDATFVTVSSSNANDIIILPDTTKRRELILQNGATGYELRTSSPTTISINGGTGINAESAIPANSTVRIICVSATKWIGTIQSSNGTISPIDPAAP